MKIEVTSKKRNPLLKRREVAFEVDHRETGGTPTRSEVRKKLATMLKTNLELVYIKKMETKTGTMVAVGEANAYDSVENAKLVEPEYIIARNLPPEKPEEEVVEKPAVKPKEKPEKKVKEPAEKPVEKADAKKEEVKETGEKLKEEEEAE